MVGLGPFIHAAVLSDGKSLYFTFCRPLPQRLRFCLCPAGRQHLGGSSRGGAAGGLWRGGQLAGGPRRLLGQREEAGPNHLRGHALLVGAASFHGADYETPVGPCVHQGIMMGSIFPFLLSAEAARAWCVSSGAPHMSCVFKNVAHGICFGGVARAPAHAACTLTRRMAPEVMESASYNWSADIWSFGITLLEMAHGHAPFAKLPPMKVLLMTMHNPPPVLEEDKTGKRQFSKHMHDIVRHCLMKVRHWRRAALIVLLDCGCSKRRATCCADCSAWRQLLPWQDVIRHTRPSHPISPGGLTITRPHLATLIYTPHA